MTVITEKFKDEGETVTSKAQLVMKGFDEDSSCLRTDDKYRKHYKITACFTAYLLSRLRLLVQIRSIVSIIQNVSSEKEKENDKDCETRCRQDTTDDNDFIPAPNTSNAGNLNIDPNEGIDSACVESSQLGSTEASEEHNSDGIEGISCNFEQLADEEAENPTELNRKVPANGTRIHYQLPDSSVVKEAIVRVISRAGKSSGVHKY